MFLKLLERLGRKRVIYDREHQVPYMYRYYLLFGDKVSEAENAKELPFNLMLHKICLSDPDVLHDHPWWYATLILKGGYLEITPTGKFWRGPGHFRISSPKSLHSLEIMEGNSSWSLFFRATKVRDWGFIKDNQWVHHRDYLAQRKIST